MFLWLNPYKHPSHAVLLAQFPFVYFQIFTKFKITFLRKTVLELNIHEQMYCFFRTKSSHIFLLTQTKTKKYLIGSFAYDAEPEQWLFVCDFVHFAN